MLWRLRVQVPSPLPMNIRHINRGDVKEGGCPVCKPRHKRYGGGWYNTDFSPDFLIEEGYDEYLDEDGTNDQMVRSSRLRSA